MSRLLLVTRAAAASFQCLSNNFLTITLILFPLFIKPTIHTHHPSQGGFTFSAIISLFVLCRRRMGYIRIYVGDFLFRFLCIIWKNERAIESSLRDDIEQQKENEKRVRLKHKYVHIAVTKSKVVCRWCHTLTRRSHRKKIISMKITEKFISFSKK